MIFVTDTCVYKCHLFPPPPVIRENISVLPPCSKMARYGADIVLVLVVHHTAHDPVVRLVCFRDQKDCDLIKLKSGQKLKLKYLNYVPSLTKGCLVVEDLNF